MDIIYKYKKHKEIFNDSRLCQQEYGQKLAKKIQQRLFEIDAVNVLQDLYFLPGPRCHELKGKRKGQFAVNLDKQFRLIFVTANEPVPLKEDGGIDLVRVTKIVILGMEDYHE